jgi:hypothetical protein
MKKLDNKAFNIALEPVAAVPCMTAPGRRKSTLNRGSNASNPVRYALASTAFTLTAAIVSVIQGNRPYSAWFKST